MKTKAPYFVLGACLLVLAGCTTEKKETTKSNASSTTISTTTKQSSTEKETKASSSKEKEPTKSSSNAAPKEENTVESGKKLLLGKWKTKDPNAHVIVENTYQEDGTYVNFSDARGDTSSGTYKVTAFDGKNITISTSLNGLDHTQTYTFSDDQKELTSTDAASGITEAYVKE